MNELDLAITAALRADAQEAEMATDTARENEKLQARLDEAEQTHRRRTVVWAALAAAAAVVVIVAGGLFLGGRGDTQKHQQQPAAPTSSALHSDPNFSPTFTMTLPDWVVANKVSPFEDSVYSWWTSCDVPATCTDLSVSRFDGLVTNGPKLTYDAYLQHLSDLATQGTITLSASIPRTVDGRRATEIDASSTKEVPNVLGCAGADCQDVQPAMRMRYVVVDMGSGQTPVVIFAETAKANPHADAWLAQLDTVLSSIKFGAH